MIRKFLTYIYRKLTFRYILNFESNTPDVEKWKEFLNEFPTPKDDYDLSYFKYKCRMYYFPLHYKIIMNVLALFVCLFLLPILLLKRNKITESKPYKDFFIIVQSSNVNYKDIIPDELSEKYGKKVVVNKPNIREWYLSKGAKKIFFNTFFNHPFSFYYNLIVLKELCTYGALIEVYSPRALVVYVNERNIAGPLIASLCESKEIDFVSFMHGDYLLHLIQGFMRFTKFYIWDDHYKRMFIDILKCPEEQFKLYKPKKLKHSSHSTRIKTSYDYYATYYFGAESLERINKVAKVFIKMKEQGKKCKVRPHPRRSNLEAIKTAFKDFEIEDPIITSMEESMEETEYIIGLNSTVLLEAYYRGKKVVIDNYSEPNKYKNLKKREYIMLNKEHKLLTELGNYT